MRSTREELKRLRLHYLKRSILILLVSLAWVSCDDGPVYAPKPRSYPKIEYPKKQYKLFDEAYCKLSFEYPDYATVRQDKTYFDEAAKDPCWFDITFSQFGSTIHCSYAPIKNLKGFEKLKQDAFSLVYKHNIKADYIDEFPIEKPGMKGFVFDLEGPTASPFQFYVSDEENHFIRGSLYFNTSVQVDSMTPVYEFLKKDVMHLIETLKFDP